MTFFIRAKSNESVVLKTFGIPINVAYSWSLIPFPCCQVAKRLNLGRYNIRFESTEIITRDEMTISLVFSAKFIVDKSSRSKMMKAYKDLVGYEDEAGKEVIDIDSKIIQIIHEVVKKDVAKMSLSEIIKFNWLVSDTIYTEVRFILKDSSVLLTELTLEEIQQFPLEEETIIQEVQVKLEESQEFLNEEDQNLLESGNDFRSLKEPEESSLLETREEESMVRYGEQITLPINKPTCITDEVKSEVDWRDLHFVSSKIITPQVSVLFIENTNSAIPLIIKDSPIHHRPSKQIQLVADKSDEYSNSRKPNRTETILNINEANRNNVILRQTSSDTLTRSNSWKILKDCDSEFPDNRFNDGDVNNNSKETAADEFDEKTHLLPDSKNIEKDSMSYADSDRLSAEDFANEMYITDEKSLLLRYPDSLSIP